MNREEKLDYIDVMLKKEHRWWVWNPDKFNDDDLDELIAENGWEIDDDSILCPECKYVGHEEDFGTKTIYEYGDADGNRGIWVNYLVCPECREEF